MKTRSLNPQEIINLLIAGAMLAVIVICLTFLASPARADTERYWWTGVALGADPAKGSYNALTVSGGWFPTTDEFNWGVQGYLEAGQYDYYDGDGSAMALGIEPVLTWKGLYGGLGLALGNTTPNLGTIWNFSTVVGYRHHFNDEWSVDGFFRHRSHARALGIETDKSNTGVNILGLQVVYRW